MSAKHEKKRTIGIAALMVVGLMAGFLVATTASGEEFSTVGTVADDNQAYTLPLEEDQRVRFLLDGEDAAENAEARFAVYDPEDRFFSYFHLTGDGDDAEMLADHEGDWVVFVTESVQADLAVQLEGEQDRNATESPLTEIAVDEQERTIAQQDGGALDEELAMRLDQRPAVAFLEFEGEVADLDATVRTEEGPVYEIQDGQANATENGTVARSGTTELTPANLAEGTYKIQASADEFSGTLTFVYQTYDRGDAAEDAKEKVERNPLEGYAVVTAIEEHEAVRIPTQGIDELTFAVKGDTHAEAFVYNSSDDFVEAVELDGDDPRSQASWWNGSDANESENESADRKMPIETLTVNVTGPSHVVYTHYLSDGEKLMIALPDGAAQVEIEPLEIETTEVVFEHGAENQTQLREANLTGGLVGLNLHSEESFAMEREITVTGPLGDIAHIREQTATFGFSMYEEHAVEYSHFSDGLMEISFSQENLPLGSQLAQGETTVELDYYN